MQRQRMFDKDLAENRKRRDNIMRSAWLRIPAAFKCRPYPRSAWDEAARGDLPHTPWRHVLHPIRSALYAALETKDLRVIHETQEAARAFFRELEADALSVIPDTSDMTILQAVINETIAQGTADLPQLHLVRDASPIAAEQAVIPLERHYTAIAVLLEKCRRKAREIHDSNSQHARVWK